MFSNHYQCLRKKANTTITQYNLLYKTLHFYLTELTPTLISSITELILTNYLQYKYQTIKSKLYKAFINKHIKYMFHYFNVYKRNTLTKTVTKYIKSTKSMPNIHLNATKLWDKLHTHSVSSNRTITNFINRQNKYKHIRDNDKEKIFNHYEEEYNAMCPFNPKLFKSPNVHVNAECSAYQRLYKQRNDNNNKKEKEQQQQSSINKNNNKTFDEHKIEQLYEDYKLRQRRQRNLTNKIDLERGYTYTPDIGGKGIYTTHNSTKRKTNYNKHTLCSNNSKDCNNTVYSNSNYTNSNNKGNKDYTRTSNKLTKGNVNVKEFCFIYDYIRNKNSFK